MCVKGKQKCTSELQLEEAHKNLKEFITTQLQTSENQLYNTAEHLLSTAEVSMMDTGGLQPWSSTSPQLKNAAQVSLWKHKKLLAIRHRWVQPASSLSTADTRPWPPLPQHVTSYVNVLCLLFSYHKCKPYRVLTWNKKVLISLD